MLVDKVIKAKTLKEKLYNQSIGLFLQHSVCMCSKFHIVMCTYQIYDFYNT